MVVLAPVFAYVSPTSKPEEGSASGEFLIPPERRTMDTADARTEMELLSLAQSGDRRAFAGLVRLHHGRLVACAHQLLGSSAEVDDAVQESFIRAWRALPRFDGRARLSTWLYRICVNVCLNRMRGNRRHAAADVDDPKLPEPTADAEAVGVDPLRTLEQAQLYGRVGAALETLSPSLRSAVVLVLLQGMSHKEAGDALGCAEGTVAWRIHEARRRLKDLLSDLVEPDALAAGGGA